MAKIADMNAKIAKTVVKGYQAVEGAVVGGYRRIENGFVETFLAREGETAEDAKRRITGTAPDKR